MICSCSLIKGGLVLSSTTRSSTGNSRHTHVFSRRLLNPRTLGFAFVGLGSLVLAWVTFNQFPHLWGSALTLGLLLLGIHCFIQLCSQPVRVAFFPDYFEIHYPFRPVRIAYERVERLHWMSVPTGFGSHSSQSLRIELKDGRSHQLDYMRGQLKRIRGLLDQRVYGKAL